VELSAIDYLPIRRGIEQKNTRLGAVTMEKHLRVTILADCWERKWENTSGGNPVIPLRSERSSEFIPAKAGGGGESDDILRFFSNLVESEVPRCIVKSFDRKLC
jgi:hypothetical protein